MQSIKGHLSDGDKLLSLIGYDVSKFICPCIRTENNIIHRIFKRKSAVVILNNMHQDHKFQCILQTLKRLLSDLSHKYFSTVLEKRERNRRKYEIVS